MYKVTHSSTELSTLNEYLQDLSSPASYYSGKPTQFLALTFEGVSNHDRLTSMYNEVEFESNLTIPDGQKQLKIGTIFYIPKDKVSLPGLLVQGVDVVSNNVESFKALQLAELESNPNYLSRGRDVLTKTTYQPIKVYLWSKSLSKSSPSNDNSIPLLNGLTGELLDISPFILSMDTKVNIEGGTFSISLPPITQTIEDLGVTIDRDSIESYLESQNYTIFTNMKDRTKLFFFNHISENDLVFIRYEGIPGVDVETRPTFTLPNYEIEGKNYDLIGLVDKVSLSTSTTSNSISIKVTGRDLSKLLQDDGTYFFNLENVTGQHRIAGKATQKNQLMGRIVGNNSLYYLNLYQNASIQHILQFVIQQLSSIAVVPDYLFSSYGDRRNKLYIEGDTQLELKDSRGIWQIVKLVIDKNVSIRRVVDSTLSSQTGPLLNFIKKICVDPFVEFYTDTYGDMFYLIVRKPPFDKIGMKSYIDGTVNTEKGYRHSTIVEIEEGDVGGEEFSFESTAYSWYTFKPQNNTIGGNNVLPLSYIPALFFEEYAEIWGSKPLQIIHNYNPYFPYNTEETKNQVSVFEKQAYEDLRYLVECNSYLPFSRKGTITITNGDRRLKRGNLVRYRPTGEIFHIDSVSNQYSINSKQSSRTTTITVSRGLVERYIDGVEIDGQLISYFNIINTNINLTLKKFDNGVRGLDRDRVFEEMKVNRRVFDFFLKRRQYE